LVTTVLDLKVLRWMLSTASVFIAVGAMVIFQPELRRMLARLLGSSPQASQVDPPIDADNGLLESEQVNPTVCQNDNGNTQNDGNTEQTESRESVAAIPLLHRKHGGALPK